MNQQSEKLLQVLKINTYLLTTSKHTIYRKQRQLLGKILYQKASFSSARTTLTESKNSVIEAAL